MTKEQPKALFFIFLLLSSPALAARLEVQEGAAVNGTALVGLHQPGRGGGLAAMRAARLARGTRPTSYSRAMQSVRASAAAHDLNFCPRCIRGAYNGAGGMSTSVFESTQVLTTSTGSSYTRTTIQTVVETTCGGMLPPKPMIPPVGPIAPPPYVPHDVGFDAEVAASITPYWPMLLAAGVVMMGGLYLYHRHRMNGPVPATFCPVSSWQPDPVGMLVGPAAHEAFGDGFTSLLSEDNNRGMPKCHGLRRHRLRSDCDGDVDCKRQACRQMCCDRRDCTFYQFNTIDSTDNCWLGSRNRLSARSCDHPFFGETCTTCRDRQATLWPQMHEDNMKCHSALIGFTGFHVENQYECQHHAVEQGHPFYQYDATRHKCETEATCDNPSTHTMHNWQIFSSENAPPPQPAAARPAPDQEAWQFEPFLLHENGDMTTVQLARSEQCSAGDVTCMRDACRDQCLQHDWCIHYQFQNGDNSCQLGATHVIDEDDVGMWFGGVLAANRQCAADEYKCPSSHNCVLACGGECDGHSREGPDGWCVRSAVENIVASDGWTDNYNEHDIDAWCRGIERSVVTVSAGLAEGQTGADICRAACSADSDCALYQMYPSDAAQADLSEGDHVRCWLGMQDQLGRPRFSCTGRSPKRWRLLAAPFAESVRARGCHEGKVACVMSQRCVDLCADECPGFDITDTFAGICQAPANPAMMTEDVPMDILLSSNLPSPVLYPEDALRASENDLFTMSVNLNNFINPDTFQGDTTAVCDVIPEAECDLVDGACVCEYDEDINCDMLFPSRDSVSPVLAEEGMMLLSHNRCSCEGRTCSLGLLNSVPPVRTSDTATSAVQLSNNEAEVCDPTMVCPNMDSCTAVSYGTNGCGWDCQRGGVQHWCSSRCACNTVEAVSECSANTMCPDMDSCNPISYGEYGCGYGCMRGSTYFFCNDACNVCNE